MYIVYGLGIKVQCDVLLKCKTEEQARFFVNEMIERNDDFYKYMIVNRTKGGDIPVAIIGTSDYIDTKKLTKVK